MQYLYLHGFASGISSQKLKLFIQCFQAKGLDLHTPALNQNDFTHLTLTRQIEQVETLLNHKPEPWTIIGSSFGGLTAAWVTERQPLVQRLVLLAPAFEFANHWLTHLGAQQVAQWRHRGIMDVYHYDAQQPLPLHYDFVDDLCRYTDHLLQRSVPTLIIHGQADTTIPVTASQAYGACRPWVTLKEVASDHTLADVRSQIWLDIQHFLKRSKAA